MSGWSIPLDKLAAKAGADIETVGRKATFDLFKAVVMRSPVDTGRFRGNWFLSAGIANASTSGAPDKSGGSAISAASQALTTPLGGTVYFTNSLPYAVRLEYGYSKQAPSGMVRITVREFNQYVKAALKS